jgi:leucyl aminopeptidase
MKFDFQQISPVETGALALLCAEDGRLGPRAEEIEGQTGGALRRAMASARFTGAKGQVLELLAPSGLRASRLLLLGIGKPGEFTASGAEAAGASLAMRLLRSGEREVALVVDAISAGDGAGDGTGAPLAPAEIAARLALGARLGSYDFARYRTKLKDEDKPTLETMRLMLEDPAAARHAFAAHDGLAESVVFARDLVNEPANVLSPAEFAVRAEKELRPLGVEVTILGEKQLREIGMNTLLAVGQGSEHESQVVVMRWNGAGPKEQPVAFIGKGVCFDSGGISIKPAAGMDEMKMDMAGAATVTGLMRALAARKARANVVGVIGLVENMPDGKAQRPGDIVTTLSGQTVEVLNTDAEGRLVLADCLWYVQNEFKPRFMIDLATLTGAIIISLGHEYAGLFTNSDELAERLTAAGRSESEPVWRLPLGEEYDKKLKSRYADMANISGGRDAGSITAAQFLQRFTNGVPWAHLDIAGTAWINEDKATVPKGGTGYGVRLLNRLVATHYEQ